MYQEKEMQEVEQIRSQYEKKGGSKIDELKKLNRSAHRPAKIIAYILGIVGSLILGVGMCLAMKIIGDLMVLGIVVGCVGIAMVSANYFIYKKIVVRAKKKYSGQILQLTDEMLGK